MPGEHGKCGRHPGLAIWLALSFLAATSGAWAAGKNPDASAQFSARFAIELATGQPQGIATIRIAQDAGALRALDLAMPAGHFTPLAATGRWRRQGQRVIWDVPTKGGELRYRVQISNRRSGKGYDALVTQDWAIFRADDVFPPAEARLARGATGRSELRLSLPSGWTSFTPYLPGARGDLLVPTGQRRFSRPVGWLIAGRIGSRMDTVGGTTVRIAGPRGTPLPRVPMLSLLRASLPVLRAKLPDMPEQLLIVMAGDPMWRGGLSAPNSIYLHADRPLISENATSPLLHELLHVLAPVPTVAEADWIDEGLAEYLALRTLRDADAISPERFARTIEKFRKRGERAPSLATDFARADVTAKAVALFADLDRELQDVTGRRADLFTLARRMMRESRPIDARRLRDLALEVSGGRPLRSVAPNRLAGVVLTAAAG